MHSLFGTLMKMSAGAACASFTLAALSFGQEPRPTTVAHAVVVDSRGKTVGGTLGGLGLAGVGAQEFRPTILLRVGQRLAVVRVGRDRFFSGGSFYFYFDLPNCTGRAWLADVSEPTGVVPVAAIGPPGQTIYLRTADAAAEVITAQSLTDGISCSNSTTLPFSAFPTDSLLNLESVFTPPFSLKAAP